MDDKIFDQIHDVDLKKTMEKSYIDYAMSIVNVRVLSVIQWVNIIHTGTAPSMVPW